VRHFADEFSRRMNKTIETIPSETMKALCQYRWPGNVRELQNVIERAVILSPGPVLKVLVTELQPRATPVPATLQTLFDGGRRHAVSAEAQAGYDAAVASYRQTVLNAFQEVG